jgi:ribosome maturation factor RimP
LWCRDEERRKDAVVSDVAERLWNVVEPYVAAEGIELDDLEIVGNGRGTIVRVVLDGGDPVAVDRIASLSRGISRIFDEEDPFAGSYTLEVGSPGLERKLRRPAHYGKSIGRDAKVKVKGAGGFETLRGTITAADDEGFVLRVEGEERRIAFADVTSASTLFVWQKSPKPGKEGR